MGNKANRKASKKKSSYANRGKRFEKHIDEKNSYYLMNDIAVVHKKPTAMRIINRKGGMMTAIFAEASTTDYNGVYKGMYIDFDAKQTAINTSFPLKNIGTHQYKHLLAVKNHKGVSFLLVRFSKLDEVYLLPIEVLKEYWEEAKIGGRKSIPYDDFVERAYKVEGYDYLPKVLEYIKDYNY